MYRPVRTYLGSARAPRKKKSQPQALPQNQELVLGHIPPVTGNAIRPVLPDNYSFSTRSVSPSQSQHQSQHQSQQKLQQQNGTKSSGLSFLPSFLSSSESRPQVPPQTARARSISPILVSASQQAQQIRRSYDSSTKSNTLINPVMLNPPSKFPPFPVPTTDRRSRSVSPTIEQRAQAEIEYQRYRTNLDRENNNIIQNRQYKLSSIKHIPLELPPDGRQIYQNSQASQAVNYLQGGSNSSLNGYISPRDFGIAQANPTISQATAIDVEGFNPTNRGTSEKISERMLGIANGNPTISQGYAIKDNNPQHPGGQKVLIKEQSSINYRENEQNLILYSYDRNWLENTTENRYDFTVNFDTESLRDGFHYSASVDRRYRNITRIELIKTIIAAESLENVVLQMGPNSDPNDNQLATTDTTYQVSPLSFPYVNISLQEFDGNNSGTDENLNRTFANLQFDAQWHTDILHQNQPGSEVTALRQTTTRGFLAMIPKYMKCQRVFYPTPLATLSKMSIRLTRPNGQLLSVLPDQLDISSVFANTEPLYSIDASKFGNQIPAMPITGRTVTYLFLQTPYFPRSCFSQGDRIQIRGILYDRAILNSYLFNAAGLRNLESWLNREEGHIIVGIGNNGANSSSTYQDGPNKIGYANFIIIQSKYSNLDGNIMYESVGNANDIAGANAHFCAGPRKLINMSRQTTIVFRVITRDLDSMSNIRPDNTY